DGAAALGAVQSRRRPDGERWHGLRYPERGRGGRRHPGVPRGGPGPRGRGVPGLARHARSDMEGDAAVASIKVWVPIFAPSPRGVLDEVSTLVPRLRV